MNDLNFHCFYVQKISFHFLLLQIIYQLMNEQFTMFLIFNEPVRSLHYILLEFASSRQDNKSGDILLTLGDR